MNDVQRLENNFRELADAVHGINQRMTEFSNNSVCTRQMATNGGTDDSHGDHQQVPPPSSHEPSTPTVSSAPDVDAHGQLYSPALVPGISASNDVSHVLVNEPSSPSGLSVAHTISRYNKVPSQFEGVKNNSGRLNSDDVIFRDAPPVTRVTASATQSRDVSSRSDAQKTRTIGQPTRITGNMNYAAAANKVVFNGSKSNSPKTGSSDGFITVGRNGRPLRPGVSGSVGTADLNLKPQRPRKSDIVYISNINPDMDSDGLKAEIRDVSGSLSGVNV